MKLKIRSTRKTPMTLTTGILAPTPVLDLDEYRQAKVRGPRRVQPRLINPRGQSVPRIPSHTSLEPALRDWVIREARHFNVSPAFVLANCVSFASGIPVLYNYQARDREAGPSRKAAANGNPGQVRIRIGGGK